MARIARPKIQVRITPRQEQLLVEQADSLDTRCRTVGRPISLRRPFKEMMGFHDDYMERYAQEYVAPDQEQKDRQFAQIVQERGLFEKWKAAKTITERAAVLNEIAAIERECSPKSDVFTEVPLIERIRLK